MSTSTTGERVTAIISTLVAVAILGAAVTAQQSATPPADRLATLESDLRYQLDMAWRQDTAKLKARTTVLDNTLEEYRKSPQSKADADKLAAWLRKSIVSSMPGEAGELPKAPEFGATIAPRVEAKKENESGDKGHSSKGASTERPTRIVAKKEPVEAPKQAPHAATVASPQSQARPVAPAAAANDAEHRPTTVKAERSTTKEKVTEPAQSTAGIRAAKQGVAQATVKAPAASAAAPANSAPLPEEKSITVRRIAAMPAGSARVTGDPPVVPATGQHTGAGVVSSSSAKHAPGGESLPLPATAKTKEETRAIELNLAELNARIGGYHDGLDEIAAAIVGHRQTADVEAVEKQVRQLEELASQYQFVRLYYDALSEQELLFVLAPRPMKATIELVEMERRRVETADEDFLLPADAEGPRAMTKLERRLKAVGKLVARAE